MKQEPTLANRLMKIITGLTLMVVVVVLVGGQIRKRSAHAAVAESVERLAPMSLIPESQYLPHKVSTTTPHNVSLPAGTKQRSLKDYYSRRAYPGAPPHIPHAVSKEMKIKQNCNVCHEKGGYVPHLQAFTPVTPHPDYVNCLQCHGLNEGPGLFKETMWEKMNPPALKKSALPGGPLQVPHSLQYRQNCQACHSGPAAMVEIRSPHPERVNCIQCHTPDNSDKPFSRSVK